MSLAYRDRYLSEINKAILAVESAPEVEGMESTKVSLLRKLRSKKQEYLSKFVNDDQILKMPSMGLLKVSREYGEPQYLYGHPHQVKTVVRFELFSASVNKVDGSINQEDLMLNGVLSESQLGECVVEMNSGEGTPITLETIYGQPVEKYQASNDLTKEVITAKERDAVTQPTCYERADELKVMAEDSISGGKITKSKANELLKGAQLIVDQFPANQTFGLKQYTKQMNEVISAAHIDIHHDVRAFADENGVGLIKHNSGKE
ncbi:hypothetical protein VCHA53O466_50251 [Vibrio chagasii]|nr:hypothetical protein VCHA53O466_50251 [Vibrio chagasii]